MFGLGGNIMAWVLEVSGSMFENNRFDEDSMRIWLREVCDTAYRQLELSGLYGTILTLVSAIGWLSV